jgi:hypothetical protein
MPLFERSTSRPRKTRCISENPPKPSAWAKRTIAEGCTPAPRASEATVSSAISCGFSSA